MSHSHLGATIQPPSSTIFITREMAGKEWTMKWWSRTSKAAERNECRKFSLVINQCDGNGLAWLMIILEARRRCPKDVTYRAFSADKLDLSILEKKVQRERNITDDAFGRSLTCDSFSCQTGIHCNVEKGGNLLWCEASTGTTGLQE